MTCPSEASSQFATREAFAFDERDSKIHLVGPVAQLDRANGYEPLGREFESLRAHHSLPVVSISSEIIRLLSS